jgi:hypothetical protein
MGSLSRLIKGETWFPQRGRGIHPREIVTSLSNLIRYKALNDGRIVPIVQSCSPESFREWIKEWNCKL